MRASKPGEMQVVQSWDEVPAFKTEAEEAEFWATHALGGPILEGMGPVADEGLPPARPRMRAVAVRFD